MSKYSAVVFDGFSNLQVESDSTLGITTSLEFSTGGRYSVCSVFGFGAIFGTPFSTASELATALGGRQETPDHILQAIKGSTTMLLKDSDLSQYYLIPDLLGGGKVFYWSNARRWAASASLVDLVDFLKGQGESVTKSAANAAQLGFVGYSGGAVKSPYNEIHCLDQFSYLAMSKTHGMAIRKINNIAEILGVGSVERDDRSDLLRLVAEQIQENTEIFSSYQTEKYICQLTGGLDSRLVFSSVLASDYRDKYSTYTYGLQDSPDMVIAKGLSAEYGVPTTEYSGMRSTLVAQDPAVQSAWSLAQTGGMTSLGPASLGAFPRPDSVVLAGGWGEMFRGGFPDSPADGADHEALVRWGVNWILRSGSPYGPRIAYGGLFADQMVEQAREYVESIVKEMADLGIGRSFMPEWMYLRWSTRFNVAEITRSVSPFMHRADPLYTKDMMRLIFSTPLKDRRNGALQMDLIATIKPGLETYRYDKDYLTQDYLSSRGISESMLADGAAAVTKQYIRPSVTAVKSFAPSPRNATEAQKKEALRVKMPVRFIVRAETNQKALQRIIRERHHELNKVFDLEAFKNVSEMSPKSRPEYRRLETLTTAMNWYFEQ